jgi:protein phosphatase 2C family protein 2/3
MILGPHRVFPGRLSVTRSIGDFEAKLEQFGGNCRVIIPVPDVFEFKIQDEHDFILLASKIRYENSFR